jgi:hypothetical protein
LRERITVTKPREVTTGWSDSRKIWQNFLRKFIAQNGCVDDDDDRREVRSVTQ